MVEQLAPSALFLLLVMVTMVKETGRLVMLGVKMEVREAMLHLLWIHLVSFLVLHVRFDVCCCYQINWLWIIYHWCCFSFFSYHTHVLHIWYHQHFEHRAWVCEAGSISAGVKCRSQEIECVFFFFTRLKCSRELLCVCMSHMVINQPDSHRLLE